MLPQCYPNYKTVHRRFQFWCRNEVLRDVMTDLANALREEGALDESGCFIDATFAPAKGGGDEIGPTKRVKGVKNHGDCDRHGLPLAVSTHAANHHEVALVQLSFDFYMIEAKPHNLIGDLAYDSDTLDGELREEGIEMIGRIDATGLGHAPRMVDACGVTSDAGWWNAFLPGFSGNVYSCFAGNITPRISSASYSSQPFLSC